MRHIREKGGRGRWSSGKQLAFVLIIVSWCRYYCLLCSQPVDAAGGELITSVCVSVSFFAGLYVCTRVFNIFLWVCLPVLVFLSTCPSVCNVCMSICL